METKRGQGLRVGSLEPGDVFRIGSRVGTVLYVSESRVRVRFSDKPSDIAPGAEIEIIGKENDMAKKKKAKETPKSDRLREIRDKESAEKEEAKKKGTRPDDIPLKTKVYHGVTYEIMDDTANGAFRVRGGDGYDNTFASLTAAAQAVRSKHNPHISVSISGPAFWGLRKAK